MSVWFDLWGSGGCDILYYTIEWKQITTNEWFLSENKPVAPTERMYTVGGLEPATKYQLKVTAHNNIGMSYALYNFTTLTIDGGNLLMILQIKLKIINKTTVLYFMFIYSNCNTI